MPNLEIPVPYELDEHDLTLIKPSSIKKIKSLFVKTEFKNISPNNISLNFSKNKYEQAQIEHEESQLKQIKQLKPIKPEPLKYIDILKERKEKIIAKKEEFSSSEITTAEKEILNKLNKL